MDIHQLIKHAGLLKTLPRTGWKLRDIPTPESISDHTFRVTLMALLISPQANLDTDKCIKIALIHDLGESIVGDITPFDGITKEQKHQKEQAAFQQLFSDPQYHYLYDLWQEYEQRQTPESQFVYQLDKLETTIQAYEYQQTHPEIDLQEFFEQGKKLITHPILVPILRNYLKLN